MPIPANIKPGMFISDIPAEFYNAVAKAINEAIGSAGIVFGLVDGKLKAVLGDENFSFRTVSVCEPCWTDDGVLCLKFQKVNCLCSAPTAPRIIRVGNEVRPVFSAEGELEHILFGTCQVDVEACDQ